jgi:hypothetical protein
MDVKKQGDINNILQKFNRQIAKIFKVLDRVFPDDRADMCHIKQVLQIAREEMPERLITEGGDKLWDNRERIIARDVDFFLQENNMSKYAGSEKTKSEVNTMVKFVGREYNNLTVDEMNFVWDTVHNMLKCVIEYRIIMGDYIN